MQRTFIWGIGCWLMAMLPLRFLGQTPQSPEDFDGVGLRNRVQDLHAALRVATEDSARLALHAQLETTWGEVLRSGTALDPAWEELKGTIGWAEAGTGPELLRVVTWNVELSDRTQRYGGFVLRGDHREPGGYRAYPLKHQPRSNVREVGKRFWGEVWPGAIYYQVILTHDKRTPVYTLLGWDGADGLTTRKVVEVLETQGGQVRLGAPRIQVRGATQRRLVLEYADVLSVLLRYEGDRIAMDHLSPRSPDLQGVAAFYGPDMTYDALEWDGKQWVLRENVDIRDPQLDRTFPDPKAPKSRRGPR
jgi:hypothetical protein